MADWLEELQGTEWKGRGELWLDPTGNNAEVSDCTLTVVPDGLAYTWSYKGDAQKGTFQLHDRGATWSDTWHQAEPKECATVPGALGLFTVGCSYEAPPGPDWHWHSKLSQRPDGSLVLQMTNITPWGEEGRAVRMVFEKVD